MLGQHFQPFVDFLLPTLLNHIAEEIQVSVRVEGTGDFDDDDDEGEDGTDTYSIYRRGLGRVHLRCNTYQVSVLAQY